MGYVSFDASVKIHQSGRYTSTKTSKSGSGGIYGYIRHIDRGTDAKNGCEVGHSNPDIDPNMTFQNETYYRNEAGELKQTEQSRDLVSAIQRRIDYARKHGARIYDGGHNDTTIVRPLIVQLDPDTIAGHENTWANDCIEILEDMFGRENIAGYSIHRDETNFHLHVAFVPVFESENGKCSVSQTKFFTSPKSLAAMHRKIRKSLKSKGYDVEMENKPIDEQLAGYSDKSGNWHQQGLTPDQLKQITDLDNLQISIHRKEVELMLKRRDLDEMESVMLELQKSAKEKSAALEQQQQLLKEQKIALEQDTRNVQAQLQALIQEKMSVQEEKNEAKAMLDKAESLTEVCNRILGEEKHLNSKFLEFLDQEGREHKQDIRGYVEFLYKKFQKKRNESLSGWQKEMIHDREMRMKQGNVKKTDSEPNIITTEFSPYDYSY